MLSVGRVPVRRLRPLISEENSPRGTTPKSREIAEVEVESVALEVLDALGLNSAAHSFPLRGPGER